MTDVLTPEQRHRNMSHIHGKDTKPEMLVRKFLFSHGFRYRLHVKTLPGKPDIVLKKYHTAVFINGCFWHGHKGCKYFVIPKTRIEWWKTKIQKNQERDKRELNVLKELGWHTIVIWECQLKPTCRIETLKRLVFTLNEIHIQDLQFKYKKKSEVHQVS